MEFVHILRKCLGSVPVSLPSARYPTQYSTTTTNGVPVPITETNNALSHPSGPEYQLVVGEGEYAFVSVEVNLD